LRIRLYGRLVDGIGSETEVPAPDGCTVAEIRRLFVAVHPAATGALGRSRAFVEDRLVGEDEHLSHHDVLEFLPPVSGG